MSEISYTATHVKLVKTLFIFMAGVTLFQTLTIRRIVKKYAEGHRRFETLHEGTVYLLDVIQENNIDLTDLDVIALTNIFRKLP